MKRAKKIVFNKESLLIVGLFKKNLSLSKKSINLKYLRMDFSTKKH